MAYTEPPVVNQGDTAVPADWNAYIRDNFIDHEANKQDSIETLVYEDQKAQNTAGGGFTSGSWQTRVLTTEVVDSGGHGALSSNQVTLDGGTYELLAWAQAHDVDYHQMQWYNITDAAADVSGLICNAAEADSVIIPGLLMGVFTIAASKVFELQHRCTTTQNTDGFGKAMNIGTEIYAQVMLKKLA